MPQLPILYSFRRCPYAMRARMALIVSGMNCVLREVRFSNKPPEMLVASPKGTVPVMVLPDGPLIDGHVIDESIDIMNWAFNPIRHPELVSPLVTDVPGSYFLALRKSKMLKQVQHDGLTSDQSALITQNDGAFKYHLDRYKYPEKYGTDTREHRDTGEAILRDYEALLAQSPSLSGQKPGFTDYALLPFIRQFAHVDRDYFYALPMPHLQNWLRVHVASDLFAQTMKHYPVWTAGDAESLLLQR